MPEVHPELVRLPLLQVRRGIGQTMLAELMVVADRTVTALDGRGALGESEAEVAMELSDYSSHLLIVQDVCVLLSDRGARLLEESLTGWNVARAANAGERLSGVAPRASRAWRPQRTRSSGSCATDLEQTINIMLLNLILVELLL